MHLNLMLMEISAFWVGSSASSKANLKTMLYGYLGYLGLDFFSRKHGKTVLEFLFQNVLGTLGCPSTLISAI